MPCTTDWTPSRSFNPSTGTRIVVRCVAQTVEGWRAGPLLTSRVASHLDGPVHELQICCCPSSLSPAPLNRVASLLPAVRRRLCKNQQRGPWVVHGTVGGERPLPVYTTHHHVPIPWRTNTKHDGPPSGTSPLHRRCLYRPNAL